MGSFDGFPEGKVHPTPIPNGFFDKLLSQIDHLGELKLTLYIFWKLDQMEGPFRFLRHEDLVADKNCLHALHEKPQQAKIALEEALQMALNRGTLITAKLTDEDREETLYFLNSPKGRAAVRAIESGRWRATNVPQAPIEIIAEPPNIFKLYEENIGPLTPLIADALGEAEDTYPIEWIEDAIRIAVEKNKRSWRYTAAILDRWQREGRDAQKTKPEDRQDAAEARQRYIKGEFSDFVEH